MPDYQRPRRSDAQHSTFTPANDADQLKIVPNILALIPDEEPQDSLASKEAAAFASGDLRRLSEQNAHRREERAKGLIHMLTSAITISIGIAMLCIGAIWFYHFVTPESLHFLSNAKQEEMKSVILAGLFYSRFQNHITKNIA
jgi:hypothetical protein